MTTITLSFSAITNQLFTCVSNNHYNALHALITLVLGTDLKNEIIDYQNDNGDTLLMIAVKKKHIKCIDILIQARADQNILNYNGNTAFKIACAAGNLDILKKLDIKYINTPNKIQDTPLIVAAYYGYSNIVEYLLDVGADPSIRNTAGKTALDYAQEKGREECVKLLLDECNKKTHENQPPIQRDALIQSLRDTINAQQKLIQELNEKLGK